MYSATFSQLIPPPTPVLEALLVAPLLVAPLLADVVPPAPVAVEPASSSVVTSPPQPCTARKPTHAPSPSHRESKFMAAEDSTRAVVHQERDL